MKGDFSRFTNILTGSEHYSSVLMQQGQVLTDSDWNEQALIQLSRLQALARDLMGEHGCRKEHAFEITPAGNDDFQINAGRYYIEGVVCENEANITYLNQQQLHYPSPPELVANRKYLVYLHGWLRHITHIENEHIRDVALAGAVTSTRIQNLWRVMVKDVTHENIDELDLKTSYDQFRQLLGIDDHQRGRLQARANKPETKQKADIVSSEDRYHGVQNTLYRVEIHASTDVNSGTSATFKWSRDNGAVVFPITDVNGTSVKLAHLNPDPRRELKVGDWVEVVDDDYELMAEVEQLLKVVAIDRQTMEVTLSDSPQRGSDDNKHPLLRRWDHNAESGIDGALPVETGKWIDLENGIQICFPEMENAVYKTRQWWWIPARAVTGDVEWPREHGYPLALEALDPGHRYAPLAMVNVGKGGEVTIESDLRRKFNQLWT